MLQTEQHWDPCSGVAPAGGWPGLAPDEVSAVAGEKKSEKRGTRIGLVGCVKSKLDRQARAKDLYTSPLFRGARRSVERTCDEWYILSAEHGLVAPDDLLLPYERTLKTVSALERREWARQVLQDIDERLGTVSGVEFELHAGAAYLNFGLVEGLLSRGANVVDPLQGLSMGIRLAYYKGEAP